MGPRAGSDEEYVIGLCDEILGCDSRRQHHFDFLRGDPSPKRPAGTMLPVDAYYPQLALVIEYRERQHSTPVPHFDKPGVMTVSGCDRGAQRRRYDQRRREVLPANGITLVEIEATMLAGGSRRKLDRNLQEDRVVLRELLTGWIRTPGA